MAKIAKDEKYKIDKISVQKIIKYKKHNTKNEVL